MEADTHAMWRSIDRSKLSLSAWLKIDMTVSGSFYLARFFGVLSVGVLWILPWVYGIPLFVVLAAGVMVCLREACWMLGLLDDVEVESHDEESFRMLVVQRARDNRHRQWARDILAEHASDAAADPFQVLAGLAAKARESKKTLAEMDNEDES